MKYFKKFLIVGVLALFGVSFCKADNYIGNFSRTAIAITSTAKCLTAYINTDFCIYQNYSNTAVRISIGNANDDCIDIETPINSVGIAMLQNNLYCFKSGTQLKVRTNNATNLFIYDMGNSFSGTGNCPTCPTIDSNYCTENNLCPSCPSCPSQYTSLECQTEYSLIPVSSVTENYCTSNFDLISPSDCPLSSGTGDTQRSALYLNNIQYAGASNIFLNISDILDYSTTYIDSGSSFVLDVDGYVADTGYLNDILTVQEFHPDNGDFVMSFVGGLTLLLPYLVVVLFVMFIWKLIRKIFKS